MTPIGGSAHVITAIVEHIASNPQQKDRSIRSIRYLPNHSQLNLFEIETTAGHYDCQRFIYQAQIQPTCQIEVQQLSSKKYVCR